MDLIDPDISFSCQLSSTDDAIAVSLPFTLLGLFLWHHCTAVSCLRKLKQTIQMYWHLGALGMKSSNDETLTNSSSPMTVVVGKMGPLVCY